LGDDVAVTPPHEDAGARRRVKGTWLRVFLLCLAAYTLTWPGRITFPDDEIQFRTAESLYESGSFVIRPMDRRTGELKGRPTGSFGVVPNRRAEDGSVYSFFGQGLAVAATPFVAAGDLLHRAGLADWRYATRSDTQRYAARSPRGDLRRMVVSWCNCLWGALAACALGAWLLALGLRRSSALFASLCFALGTSAWSYTSTFLSEPLSSLCLLVSFWQAELYKRSAPGSGEGTRALCFSALAAGFAVHVHILNLLAAPFVIAYAAIHAHDRGRLTSERRAWLTALSIGASAVLILGLSQWWRFGSPFTTGRYDHYSHWVWPFEALAAFVVAPGRSLFLYAPPLLLGIWGWRSVRARFPTEWACVLGLVGLRALFVACRSDWSGGWSLGPRYLIPCIPLLLLPAALAWEDSSPRRRRVFVGVAIASALLQAWMASHAIAEHMLTLSNIEGVEHYGTLSHWQPSASPFAGFWRMDTRLRQALLDFDQVQAMAVARLDMVSFGAIRLWLVGKSSSLLAIMGLWGLVGAIAGLSLLRNAQSASKSAD
jgi:hypothetical protein